MPLLIAVTKGMGVAERRHTVNLAFYVCVILLVGFAILGQGILLFFGITLHSFMIAGGILLLILSMNLIFSDEEKLGSTDKRGLGAVPLAFPLLVGPGAITTTIVSIQAFGLAVALLSIAAAMAVTYLVLYGAESIHRLLGDTGSMVVLKVVAVFIAAIAVQFILTGIQYYYPP